MPDASRLLLARRPLAGLAQAFLVGADVRGAKFEAAACREAHFDRALMHEAQMNKAQNQRALLENRNVILTENIGEMEDADLSKIVTDLQNLLVNKEVAQKAFSMISQLNLFDMIA